MIIVTREQIKKVTDSAGPADVAGVLLEVAHIAKTLVDEKRIDKSRLYELISIGLQFDKNTPASRAFLDILRDEDDGQNEVTTLDAAKF